MECIPKNGKIHYDIKYIGSNIHASKKGRYYNLKPCCTKCNNIYVPIAIHEVKHLENIVYFTEMDDLILQSDLNINRHAYIMLATVQVSKHWKKKTKY